jgi:hypothetical protein
VIGRALLMTILSWLPTRIEIGESRILPLRSVCQMSVSVSLSSEATNVKRQASGVLERDEKFAGREERARGVVMVVNRSDFGIPTTKPSRSAATSLRLPNDE